MGNEESEIEVAKDKQVINNNITSSTLFISAGASHSVALLSYLRTLQDRRQQQQHYPNVSKETPTKQAGNVVCSWGRGEDGQLGHGDAEDRFTPVQLSALDGHHINSITCGADHTLAYSESSLQLYSWGCQLEHWMPDGVKIKQVACGDSHCLAVTVDGDVMSWGRNQNGQLGLDTTEDVLVPQKIQAFQGTSVKMVAAGAEHSAAVTEAGELYGWGWGRYGNLGLGDRNDRLIPEKVSAIEGTQMVLVACGWRHSISVSTAGSIYTYGWSKYGQLGHGDNEDHLTPYKLEALSDRIVLQISGGWRHTMAVTSDGKLYGWGWNKFGQVGVGDNVDRCSPVQVVFPHDQKVVQMCCGWRHTLAITDRSNVFSWGRGTNGQLGLGESVDRYSPKIIEVLSMDGASDRAIPSSKADPSTGKILPPFERYAVVPEEPVQSPAAVPATDNGGDASVPENDVKRIRVDAGPS